MILFKIWEEIPFPIGVCSKIILKIRKIISNPIETWARNCKNSDSFLNVHNGRESAIRLTHEWLYWTNMYLMCYLSLFMSTQQEPESLVQQNCWIKLPIRKKKLNWINVSEYKKLNICKLKLDSFVKTTE